MDNTELLALLERLDLCISRGILALRERLANEDKFTVDAVAEINADLVAMIGDAQKLGDLVPDFRAFALNA